MGRRRQPDIRERLLIQCTDWALAHGLPDRLQPLADATNSSTRMLIYHFGSRDALLREVLKQARTRQRLVFGDLLQARPDESYLTTLHRAWSAITGPPGRPYLRMFSQLRQDAEQQLWPGFRREATVDWIQPLAEGLHNLDGIDGADLATLVLAVIRGLITDLEATADTERADHAFDQFLDMLRARCADARHPPEHGDAT